MANKLAHLRIHRPNMRVLLLTVAVLIAGCTSCGGGGGNDNGVIPVELPEFDADRAFADIEHQCDFGPRMPGSPGHQAQLAWMISTLTPPLRRSIRLYQSYRCLFIPSARGNHYARCPLGYSARGG